MSVELAKPVGVIYCNAYIDSDAFAQYAHIQKLEREMRDGAGVGRLALFLSEAIYTNPETVKAPGLINLLTESGYSVDMRPTTHWQSGRREENICFASRDPDWSLWSPSGDAHARFSEVNRQPITWRSLSGVRPDRKENQYHTRYLGRATLPYLDSSLDVLGTHLSYYCPGKEEQDKLLDYLGQANGNQVFGGDLNTFALIHPLKVRRLMTALDKLGWQKIVDPEHKNTYVLKGRRRLAKPIARTIELDHVFVPADLARRTEMAVGDPGPSDHKPLLVTIELPTRATYSTPGALVAAA